jgi:hypothetical protein
LDTGQPHRVSQDFFQRLAAFFQERGAKPKIHSSDIDSRILGVVSSDLGEQGVDNGWNLLETSLSYRSSLAELSELMRLDLQTVQKALEEEGASVINLSIHPLGKRDLKTYKAFVAPKGIYPYFWYRGWDHTAGIDARAQNSPTTSISPEEAADAVSVIIGAGAAFIGLFANSPFEEGERSSFKEARLTMWKRMMKYSKIEGDRKTSQFPEQRFRTLAQYFNWMFGDDTAIHFVIADKNNKEGEYKGIGDKVLVIPENPSVIEFLSRRSWQALRLKDISFNAFPPTPVVVVPDISHFEAMQFAQFSGARVRFTLNKENFPLKEFLEALKNPGKRKVEEIFSSYSNSMWIEGRDPGANFPDREILEAGDEIASSVIIAPEAIQAGLIRNLEESLVYIDSIPWLQLKALREAAIKDGLAGEVDGLTVFDFANKILEIAAKGLTVDEQRYLAYPQWVLENKQNGADRAIAYVERQNLLPLGQALLSLLTHRQVVI